MKSNRFQTHGLPRTGNERPGRLRSTPRHRRRATVLLMVVGLLAMLFVLISAYLAFARYESVTFDIVEEGEVVDASLDNVNDVLLAAVRDQLRNDDGELFGPASQFADIPGYGSSAWLGANEFVMRPAAGLATSGLQGGDLDSLSDNSPRIDAQALWWVRLPAVSRFNASPESPTPGGGYSPVSLMRNYDQSRSPEFSVDDGISYLDLLQTARQPYGDADGDGIPDASFWGNQILTELANQQAGLTTRYPDAGSGSLTFYQSPGAASPSERAAISQWQRFSESARFEVAARMVSHGGMIDLNVKSSPNRWFSERMFHWISGTEQLEFPGDFRDSIDIGGRPYNLLEALELQANEVEADLRYRGGLLPTRNTVQRLQVDQDILPTAPATLAALQLDRDFQSVFARGVDRGANAWQLFNIGTTFGDEPLEYIDRDLGRDPDEDGAAWLKTAVMNAEAYLNASYGIDNARHPLNTVNPRQWLTTVNHSDDIARKLTPPDVPSRTALSTAPVFDGVFAGQLKYYLGNVQEAFDASGAFDLSGSIPKGPAVVERLYSYYYDMLSGHDWSNELPWLRNADAARKSQAWQLAVNTVAFAAPYNASDATYPTVWYSEDPGDTNERVYYGYVPQPYITQIVGVKEYVPPDPNDPEQTEPSINTGVIVELYNPHNRPLQLNEFVLTDSAIAPASSTSSLPNYELQQYEFVTIEFVLGGRSPLLSSVTPSPLAIFTGSSAENLREKTFYLWRFGKDDGAPENYLVDRQEVDLPDVGQLGPQRPFGYSTVVRRMELHAATTQTENLFPLNPGGGGGTRTIAGGPYWSAVAAFDPDNRLDNREVDYANDETDTSLPSALVQSLGSANISGLNPQAPITPLITANPDQQLVDNLPVPGFVSVHGSLRPAAFPTVGFLAFVPRFAHETSSGTGQTAVRRTIGEKLGEYTEDVMPAGLNLNRAPVDVAHMPFFSNRQSAAGDGPFTDDRLGRVPWGQLIFDYFTTFSPEAFDLDGDGENDVDPYQIPGRLNINSAPWFLLAGTPLFGPGINYNPSDRVLEAAGLDPAFHDPDLGLLVMDRDLSNSTERTLITYWLDTRINGQDIYDEQRIVYDDGRPDLIRLGAGLAAAVTSYRDRLPYGADTWNENPYVGAHERQTALNRNAALYDPVRGDPSVDPDEKQRGFITLGELANVLGFDSTRYVGGRFPDGVPRLNDATGTTALQEGDFLRAISLLALLDTHYLTTRSNTFTAYTTLFDRENLQDSVHSQLTLDRTNLLPRLDYYGRTGNVPSDERHLIGQPRFDATGRPVVLQSAETRPRVISERRMNYFSTSFD